MYKNPISFDWSEYMPAILKGDVILSQNTEKPVHKADKGEKGGSCNREACQAPGANCYNRGTNKYYCKGCAIRINGFDPNPLCDIQQDTCPK